jgi:hypothetical protein
MHWFPALCPPRQPLNPGPYPVTLSSLIFFVVINIFGLYFPWLVVRLAASVPLTFPVPEFKTAQAFRLTAECVQ